MPLQNNAREVNYGPNDLAFDMQCLIENNGDDVYDIEIKHASRFRIQYVGDPYLKKEQQFTISAAPFPPKGEDNRGSVRIKIHYQMEHGKGVLKAIVDFDEQEVFFQR